MEKTMPTYEYECQICGHSFAQKQAISDVPVTECPSCRGQVHRVVTGGAGFILKGRGHNGRGGERCSFEQNGTTCCGRQERCSQPSCEE
jgi:putative FmdB family regulatory protein